MRDELDLILDSKNDSNTEKYIETHGVITDIRKDNESVVCVIKPDGKEGELIVPFSKKDDILYFSKDQRVVYVKLITEEWVGAFYEPLSDIEDKPDTYTGSYHEYTNTALVDEQEFSKRIAKTEKNI